MVEFLGIGDEGTEDNMIQEARSLLGTIVSALSSFAYSIYQFAQKVIAQVIQWASTNPYAFTMFIANMLILFA